MTDTYTASQLAAAYFRLQKRIKELEAKHKAELEPMKDDMKLLEQTLAEQLHEENVLSVKVAGGTIGFTNKTVYKADDIGVVREFALSTGNDELLTLALSSTGVKAYLEAHKELPPGVFPVELEQLYNRPARGG